jgi:hypothetical protein
MVPRKALSFDMQLNGSMLRCTFILVACLGHAQTLQEQRKIKYIFEITDSFIIVFCLSHYDVNIKSED